MSVLDFFSEKKINLALRILKKLNEIGFEAYFVGGSVRDALLEIEPDDIDITTNANPSLIKSLFKNFVYTDEKFGVTCLLIEGVKFEIATFRKDGVYIDARRPQFIESANIFEDSKRRDFTINAIYFEPVSYEFKDFHDGLKDIQNKIIRTIGNPNERFKEDRLRIIRAIRLKTKLNFDFDENILKAIRNTFDKLKGISTQRLITEVNKCLQCERPSLAINTMFELNIVELFFPELLKLKDENFSTACTHWDLTMKMLDESDYNDLTLRWSILFLFLNDALNIESVLKRFTFSNKFIQDVLNIVKNHNKLLAPKQIDKMDLKKIILHDTFLAQLKLLHLDLKFMNKEVDAYNLLKSYHDDFEKNFPRPIINADSLKFLGFKPNSKFSFFIKKSYEDQLAGKFKNIEEAELYIKSNF